MKTFVLIDGNAIFHRAFHALPLFKTSKGEYTNAIYGFLKMFLEILKQKKPHYIAVAFDRAAKTFRHIEYAEYKATRPAPPEELYPQLPRLKEALAALKVPIFELDGYEADDILGTIAEKVMTEPDTQILIVTGDQDAFQLVTDKIHVITPLKGMSEAVEYTPEKIKEKTGLTPEQIIDYKALKGDSSDNIKGINGIGEKQAVSLLQKYHNLDNIYQHLDELSPSQQKKFTEDKENAFFSKKMATIIREVPINFDLEKCRYGQFSYEDLKTLFETLEFKTLLKQFSDYAGITEAAQIPQQQSLF